MVRIEFNQNLWEDSPLLTVKGHADYSVKGSDIVCSAVSILMYTFAEALEKVAGCSVQVVDAKEYQVYIRKSGVQDQMKAVTETILTGLSSLSEQYPEHVQLIFNQKR